MKFGCLGLLILLLILALVLVGGAAALFMGGAMFATPKIFPQTYTGSDAYRVQDKLFELVLRESGRSSRQDPIVLTDQELSAFLATYLERAEAIPLSPLMVRLHPATVEIQGRTALRNLFKGFPAYFLPKYLPASTMDRPVWVTVRGSIGVDRERAGKYGRLEVKEFSLGNQDVGPWLVSLLVGRERLRWQMPAVVETIQVQDGRIVITAGR
jgi:hypothetical protein